MVGIQLTNILSIIFTLGLAIPWAFVRTARYTASKTSIIGPAGGLGFFAKGAQQTEGALGDVGADMFDIDIGV
jgi:uncharacterized membrane protein YjgN (DUF898 family)